MPNLNLSTTQRDLAFKKLGLWADFIGRLEAIRNFWRNNQVKTIIEDEGASPGAPQLSKVSLTGVILGTSTDSAGRIFVKVTAGTPNTVSLYSDSAQTQLIAQGTGANSTTVTLAAQNNSGVNGSVNIGTGATDTKIVFRCFRDSGGRLDDAFSEVNDDNSREWKNSELAAIQNHINNATSEINAEIANMETNFIKGWLVRSLNIPSDIVAQGIRQYVYTNVSGAISISQIQGILGWLKRVMQDNTTPITVKQSVVSVAAAVADPQNKGTLVFTGVAGDQHSLPGTGTVNCTADTVGAAAFSCEIEMSLEDNFTLAGSRTVPADNPVTIAQAFADGPTGLSFTPGKATGVFSADPSSVFSLASIPTGETESNTKKGVVYIRVTRQATSPIWLIEFFNDPGLAAANKIGQATADGTTGTTVVSFSGSGLSFSFTFNLANANTAMPSTGNTYTATLDFKVPRIGDKWYFTITNDFGGNFAKFIGRYMGMALNNGASPNVDDNFAIVYPALRYND